MHRPRPTSLRQRWAAASSSSTRVSPTCKLATAAAPRRRLSCSRPSRGRRWTSCNDGPRPPPDRDSATTDSVCCLPRTKPRPGRVWSLLVSGRKRGGMGKRIVRQRNTAFAAARAANERNRPFRDGHHIGQSHRAVYYCRSDGFELPHVRLSRPLNGGRRQTSWLAVAAAALITAGATGASGIGDAR
jgi:hypothetical protein